MYKKQNRAPRKIGLLLLILSLVSACQTVTIRPNGGNKDVSQADYHDSVPFYFLGFIGKHKVDVNEACEGKEITQLQTVNTSLDVLFAVVTSGIYTPRTAKIWCGEL